MLAVSPPERLRAAAVFSRLGREFFRGRAARAANFFALFPAQSPNRNVHTNLRAWNEACHACEIVRKIIPCGWRRLAKITAAFQPAEISFPGDFF
jgi:hypothetical protein